MSPLADVNPRGTYLRIVESLREGLTGTAEQELLPSEAALMGEYGVSRTTIRRALRVLAAEGLIESLPGIGWRRRTARATLPLVEQMRSELAAGGFEVGGTFHSEAALCEQFGFSRTAVRKALGQLEGEGLLEPVHGKGRIVKALPPASGTP
ncbi:GntR family transcriptional regulator [Streptomyces sp. URMC 127]|uniref:GntR family transcriptional regulator n=1 Tax=Streptomyces sp. URMC 127 TaxID=3423402 RepID=UPI003F1CDB72